jgi:hypothetical protein
MRTRDAAPRPTVDRSRNSSVHHEPRPWSLEALEDRRLRAEWGELFTYVEELEFLSDPGWYALFGTIQVGDVSQDIGAMEVGDAQDRTYSYAGLDYDGGGRFDSGWRQFYFHADVSGGGVSWWVQGMPHVSHTSSQSYTSVTEVLVVAAVARPRMRVSWEGLSVTIRESYGLQGPEHYQGSLVADTFGRADPGAQQQKVLHVYAPGEGFNEAIVQGYVRLEAEAGVQPGAEDVFGQVLIRAA